MTSTGKRRKPKKRPKKGSPKRVPPKRARKRAKPVPVPKRTRTRTRTRKPAKRSPKRVRSAAAKKGWATRRFREAIERERAEREELEGLEPGLGDESVESDDWEPDPDYQEYPIRPIETPGEVEFAIVDRHSYAAAMEWLEERFGADDSDDGEIEWFPTFDEVYDYIDSLVDEYDLDAHELFELAFGYSDEATA